MSSPDVLRRKAALTLLRRQVDAGLSGRPLPIHHPAGTGDINFRRLNHWFSTRRAVPYVIGALGPAATASASEAVADPLMVVPFAMISLVWCAVWWLMAGDAASYNKEFARRAEAMFLDDPSIEAALLDGATVPHELLFRYGLAYPHPPVDATTLSNQLRSLGPKGRDLAIAADATGWADPAATGPAIDYLLHNPATRRFWEDLFSAPGWEPGGRVWDGWLVWLAAARLSADCRWSPESWEIVDMWGRVDLSTKVALAAGVALDVRTGPALFVAFDLPVSDANRSFRTMSRRTAKRRYRELVRAAEERAGMCTKASEVTLASERLPSDWYPHVEVPDDLRRLASEVVTEKRDDLETWRRLHPPS